MPPPPIQPSRALAMAAEEAERQVSAHTNGRADEQPLEVLFTGFGPFSSFTENPSWLAVKPLHDQTLHGSTYGSSTSASSSDGDATANGHSRPVHLQALQMPVVYSAVLDALPRLHGHAPALSPPTAEPWLDSGGALDGSAGDGRSLPAGYPHIRHTGPYEAIIHVGVGRTGFLNLETRARRVGYNFRDRRDLRAPLVEGGAHGPQVIAAAGEQQAAEITEMQRYEMERLGQGTAVARAAAAKAQSQPQAGNDSGAQDGIRKYDPREADRQDTRPRGFPLSAYSPADGFLDEERPHDAVDVHVLMAHLRTVLPRVAPATLQAHREAEAARAHAAAARAAAAAGKALPPPPTQAAASAAASPEDADAIPISISEDAGLFLCEFIYYASLAEAKRAAGQAGAGAGAGSSSAAQPGDSAPAAPASGFGAASSSAPAAPRQAQRKRTKVLFVHCPPIGEFMQTEEVTAVLREIAWWVATHDA